MVSYEYYRIFYYVAQFKSFTKAAHFLNNNQPNITRCMNLLEHQLQCTLFLRSSHGVSLTKEGEKLYAHVSIAIEQLKLGEHELKQDTSLECGTITIGASETALRLYLLDQLERFHEKYQNVHIKITNHSSPQAINALENALVDFAVVTTPVQVKKTFHIKSILKYNEILIGGTKFEHARNRVFHLSELTEIPFITLGQGTGTREFYSQFFYKYNQVFKPDLEAATTDQILPMVTHNLGIGFYPKALANEYIKKGDIIPIRLHEIIPQRTVCVITDKNKEKSIAVQKLLQNLNYMENRNE